MRAETRPAQRGEGSSRSSTIAAAPAVTHYDAIAHDYHTIKANPVKKYSEEYSVLKTIQCLCENGAYQASAAILDLACGDGHYARLFLQQGVCRRVVGVDLSQEMIARAKVRDAPLIAEGRLIYQAADCATVRVMKNIKDQQQQEMFQIVTAIYMLQYAQTENMLASMLQNVWDHLQPGGTFLAVTGHPVVTPESIAAQESYGVWLSFEDPMRDGTSVETTLRSPEGGYCRFTSRYWSLGTYGQILKQVGFIEVEWKPMEVSPEGMALYGAEFWRNHLENPAIIILQCRRPCEEKAQGTIPIQLVDIQS